MVSGPLVGAMQLLEQWGVRDVLLPFTLIFAVTYSILKATNVFGTAEKKDGKESVKHNRQVNIVVSLVVSLLIVIPHVVGGVYAPYADPVAILNQMLPGVAVIIVASLGFLLLSGVIGGSTKATKGTWMPIIAILALLAFVGVLLGAVDLAWLPLPAIFQDPTIQTIVILLIIAGGVVYYVQKEENKDDKTRLSHLFEQS